MAKNGELLDLQKTGQAFYEAKKYVEALDAFSKAIMLARKWSPSEVFPILDQRVAVHVKLSNIDLARKDAMSMIRANKADGRGYLRCGQLDRLEDNLPAALRWYEHGLKQVPGSDPLRSTLNMQREKVKAAQDKKIIFSNSRDPVSVLPAELVQFLVNYLDYRDAVRILRVSKLWKATLLRLRPLIDTIDFGGAIKVINYKMMAAALKRLGPNPKVLIISDLAESAAKLLRMNLDRWRNYTQLKELAISSTVFGSSLLPFNRYSLKILTIEHGIIPDSELAEILRSCKTLEVARFAHVQGHLDGQENGRWGRPFLCQTVRSLYLDSHLDKHDSLSIKRTFFTCFPNLEELECRHLQIFSSDEPFDLSALRKLRKVCFSSCRIPYWPILPSSVEVWDNYDTDTLLGARGRLVQLGELAKLRFLRFNKTSPMPPWQSFLPQITPSGTITHLDIRSTCAQSVDDGSFFLCLISEGHLTNLKELALDGTHGEVATMAEAFDSLAKLEALLMMASPLTGAHIIDLLKRPDSRLRKVTLVDCENISADTIQWARDQGVTMDVKRSQ